MSFEEAGEVTQLLLAWNNGDKTALDRLIPLVYQELRQIAHRYMKRERQNHTLQSFALINEAYLRMVDLQSVNWQNRAHFFAIASSVMRRVLIDYARTRGYVKRGGEALRVSFNEKDLAVLEQDADLVALDEALSKLAVLDPRQSKIVEMRFFGGLSVEETAEAMLLSPATIKREWSAAKAWLYKRLKEEEAEK